MFWKKLIGGKERAGGPAPSRSEESDRLYLTDVVGNGNTVHCVVSREVQQEKTKNIMELYGYGKEVPFPLSYRNNM